MKSKILVGVLLGAMLVSMVGCKKKENEGESGSSGKKPTKIVENQKEDLDNSESSNVLGENMFLYEDERYGFSFVVPKYTRGDYMGSAYVRRNIVGEADAPQLEKYIAVHRYLKLAHEELLDIHQINSVYDIHENMSSIAFEETVLSLIPWEISSSNISVEEKAEVINGYEMLRYEGTLDLAGVMGTETLGITGYYIFAEGLPIVVQAVDATATVHGIEYPSELSQMDSLRAEVDAMVRTFSTEGWLGLEFR